MKHTVDNCARADSHAGNAAASPPAEDVQFMKRFWAKVQKTTGCWLWTGAKGGGGYGAIKFEGKVVRAHRISWELVNGPIHDGLFVLHRCDVRLCVNPKHLFLGTHEDNMRDCSRKQRTTLGEKQGRAKLKSSDVLEIRRLRSEGVKSSVIARKFCISQPTVSQIAKRQRWSHI